MADNVGWTAGSGTTVATDDVSGVHYQRVKLVDGTLDGTGAIGGDATNGLDVDVTRVQGNVAVTLAAGAAAIAKAEDVASADADVGVPVLAVRKATPANTSGTDGDYEFLQISAGRLWASATIDAALPTGANAIGKLAANGGVNIGDVRSRPSVLRTRVASAGLTIATTAYAVGDQAGTMLSFTSAATANGGTGTIMSAVLLDKADVGVDYRLHFFRANATVAADNAAFAISDADAQDHCGLVAMPSMVDIGNNRISTLGNIGLGYDTGAGTTLYVAIETRTANAVYAAATDLNLTLTLILD